MVSERAVSTDETRKWLPLKDRNLPAASHQNLTCVQPLYRVDIRQFKISCNFDIPEAHTYSGILHDPTDPCNLLSVKALNGLLSGGGSLEVKCGTQGTESSWLWHLQVTGTCPVVPIFNRSRSEANTSLNLPAVEIQDNSQKPIIFNVCPQILRPPGRFLFFKLAQDFADQLISIASAIMLSRRHGFTLILPSHLSAPYSSMEVLEEKGKKIPVSFLYDLAGLEHTLSNVGYTVTVDLPTSKNSHLSWFKDALGHQSDIREIDFSLLKYSRFDDIVVDIGDLSLDIASLDDILHTELFQIVHFLASSLNPLIYSSVEHMRQILASTNPKGYNALDLSMDDDLTPNVLGVKSVEARWENFLLSHEVFDAKLPLYIAYGNTGIHTKCQQFLCTDKFLLGAMAFFPEALRKSSEVMAAIDMLLLVGASSFAGLRSSTFSHVIATLRDARLTFDVQDSSMPHPFHDLVEFGSLTPLPPRLCTEEKIQALKSSGTDTKSKRKLADFRTYIERLHLSSVSSVFEMTYILDLFETPGKEDLAMQMLLETTRCYHSDRVGEGLRHFLKQDPTHESLFARALCHRFPSIGNTTCETAKSSRLLIVSHSLVSDGAPVVLVDYMLFLSRVLRLDMKIVTRVGMPKHTSLQRDLEKANISLSYDSTFDAEGFDVIYINTLDMWWYKGLSSKAKREIFATDGWASKAIWWVHESARDHFIDVHPYLPKVLKSVNHAIFTTPQSRDVYKDLIADIPSTVIPNPLDIHFSQNVQLQRLRLNHRSEVQVNDSLTFILIGTIHPGRHQLDFVQAALQLLRSCPKAQTLSFVTVGFDGVENEYEAEVKAAVDDAGEDAAKHFRLVPRLSHFDCLQLLSAADVLVSMSDFEAFGMTLLEAMSMGKPVITSKVDGVPSVIYHEAIDVPLGNVLRLKEAMESMLDEKNRSLHAMHAIRHYEKFQTLDIRLKHIQVLTDAIKRRQIVSHSSFSNTRALGQKRKDKIEKHRRLRKKRGLKKSPIK
jgi:glycosyltransferase involved in cell wall biosynthesis